MTVHYSGIKLIEVRVRNFRSLRHVDVTLDDLTVFIGENNSGKTSFLEALYGAIGSGRRTLSADDIFIAKGETQAPQERSILIDLLFRPVDEAGECIESFPTGSYWTALWGSGITQDNDENDFAALRTRLHWSAGKGEHLIDRRFLTEWPESSDIESAQVNEKYGFVATAKTEPISLYFMDAKRDIQDELQNRNSFWHKLVADPGLSEQGIKEIEKKLSQLNGEIIEGSDVLRHVQTHLNDLYQSVSAEKGSVAIVPLARHLRDLSRGMDISFSTRDAESFPLARHGMGTRSLAAVLTFRAYSQWRQQNVKGDAIHPMLALEEPEAHLHPQAQRSLFHQIEAIPGQRIVSTHSPYIASQADISQLRHFKKTGAETVITQIDTRDLDHEAIRKIERMVLNTRGELLFARALVFFEGETEEQALPIFAKAYWGEHTNTLGISMIGVGGKDNYFPFIKLATCFSIPWFIFSDGEKDAKNSLSKMLKTAKQNPLGKNDAVFVIPEEKDFEAYLLSIYQKEIKSLLDTLNNEKNYLNSFMTEMHGKPLKKGKLRDYQSEGKDERALIDLLSNNKTKYAKPIAEAIVAIEDENRRFPPLLRKLFDEMAKLPGLRKPQEGTE